MTSLDTKAQFSYVSHMIAREQLGTMNSGVTSDEAKMKYASLMIQFTIVLEFLTLQITSHL